MPDSFDTLGPNLTFRILLNKTQQPMPPIYLLLISIGLAALLAACQNTETERADVIYYNATIWTGDEDQPTATAIGIKDGRILFVGEQPGDYEGPETHLVDLEGQLVLPGFIDNHTHFLSGGFYLGGIDLRPAQTPDEFIATVRDYVTDLPAGRWITNGDWDHEAWGGTLPTRAWIDSLTADHFVFVSRLDGHMALVNTPVLEAAGITKDTPDPEGGTIVRDPETGEPTGILKDEAMSLVYRIMPENSEEELDEAFLRAQGHALSLGVTQIHDVGSMGGWSDLATFRRAEEAGHRRLRIYSMVPLPSWQRMVDYIAEHGRGNDQVRWGGLKAFVDGSLGSTTAWFHEPYADAPETAGFTVNDTSELAAWIEAADGADLHLAVHAIGDRANDWLLDVFAGLPAKNGLRDRRSRIEHAQHLSRAAISRFAELGVIPSAQPYHAIDDGRWAEKRIGPERILTTYPFRSLLDADATLTFGSDWTVAPINPLEGIYAAVTRATLDGATPDGWVPEQKISVAEALRCYTAHNAFAGFQEDRLGRLKAGYLADMVVLSENIFEIEPARIREVEVLRTIIGGEEAFSRF